MKKIWICMAMVAMFNIGNAFAGSITWQDETVNFQGFEGLDTRDEIGTPQRLYVN